MSKLRGSTALSPPDPFAEDPVRSDFRNFLYLVWQHLNLPSPTEVQYDISLYLQHGPKRCVIEAFRGIGKSWITAAFVCWLLLRDPQMNIMVVSASKDRADAFSTFVKRLISEMPILAHLRPGPGCRDSNVAFDVAPARASHSPSVKSVGVTGQLTGSRADVIIADDVETPNNALTQTMRDQLSERVKEFDAVLKPNGRIIYLGTPQTEASLYNRLPERGYEIMIWPARVPVDVAKFNGRLAPFIHRKIEAGVPVGASIEPTRFPDSDLAEREASYGRSGFALQFMLDTSLSDMDRYPLKLSDLIVMHLDHRMAPAKLTWCNAPEKVHQQLPSVGLPGDKLFAPMWCAPEMADYSGCVMAIDPSGRGGDETAFAIVKILHGMLFLVDVGGFSSGYAIETLEAIATAAKRHKVNYVIHEANFGDGMFGQLLKPVLARIHPCTVEEVRHSAQKERRIADTLEPVMNSHRLVVDAKLILDDYRVEDHRKQLFFQLTRLTRDRGALKHDDRLDAVAIAVGYWVEHMARDTDKAVSEHRDHLMKRELEGFLAGVLGPRPSTGETWMAAW